jgi:hypothetical protein
MRSAARALQLNPAHRRGEGEARNRAGALNPFIVQEVPLVKLSRLSRLGPLPILAALLLLIGCSKSPLSPEQPAGQNQSFSSDPTAANTGLLTSAAQVVTGTVNGLVGGVIRNGDWTVKIPAGSFSGIGLVTVTVPDPSVRSCELGIFPSLLNSFKVPVTLSCRLQSTDEVRDFTMQWWDPGTKTWTAIPSATSAATMTCDAPLPHFSTYRCGKAGW